MTDEEDEEDRENVGSDVAGRVLTALGDVVQGKPVDLVGLRAAVVARIDQMRSEAGADPDAGPLLRHTEFLLDVVADLEDGDTEGAELSVLDFGPVSGPETLAPAVEGGRCPLPALAAAVASGAPVVGDSLSTPGRASSKRT